MNYSNLYTQQLVLVVTPNRGQAHFGPHGVPDREGGILGAARTNLVQVAVRLLRAQLEGIAECWKNVGMVIIKLIKSIIIVRKHFIYFVTEI